MTKLRIGTKIRFLGRDGLEEPCELLPDLPVGHETLIVSSGDILVIYDAKDNPAMVLPHEVELASSVPSAVREILTYLSASVEADMRLGRIKSLAGQRSTQEVAEGTGNSVNATRAGLE